MYVSRRTRADCSANAASCARSACTTPNCPAPTPHRSPPTRLPSPRTRRHPRTGRHPLVNPTVAGASGELITTTTDLNRFYHALLTGRRGHEGDIFGYQTSCWTTEDGSRQLTVAATPWGTGDLDELFDNLVATAFTHS
jgi:D-alanyl-D-alanine carboxypeptidase